MNQTVLTLLIVDDSPEDRELYRRYLMRDQEYSYRIIEASLGQEGLTLWQQHRPDVVLLDYRLPDLDGLDFLNRLQSLIQQPCLPVLLVTGQGSEGVALQAIQTGAQGYLVKELITPESLRVEVRRTVTTIQLQIQLQLQIEREQLIRHISQQIHQSLELDQILATTVTEVRQVLQTDRVLVFRLAPTGHHTVVAESVAEGWRSVLYSQISDPCFNEGYAERYREGRVMTASDIYDGSFQPCHVEFLAQFQVRANLVVPILQGDQLWGLLIAHHCSATRSWRSTELELLQQLAVHLGIALQQSNTYTQLEQQSEARYRAIVEDQTELIVRYSSDNTVRFVNSAYCRYFGLAPEEILGQPYQLPILEEDRERVERLLGSMSAANPTVTFETRMVINGEIRWTQWINRVILDGWGQCTEFQAVGRDMTPIKEAEVQLRHSSERMSLANAELARAARLKDEFLANMSHELRTPLNSILGLSETLLEEVFGSLTVKQRQFLQTIEQSGEHLLALINDVLDLSKIESGKMDLDYRSISLPSVCESGLNFVKQQAQQKRIQVICAIDSTVPEIEADERRLLQVLVNLLTNAVKFTPEGGQVKLEVTMNLAEQTVQLRVTDTGIGIAANDLPQIFQPFVQLDSTLSRRYEGTGLGLSIVQRIVDLHGGSVQVESEVDWGSCFTVVLPWHPLFHQESNAQLGSPESQSEWPETGRKIHQALVVEDSSAAAGQIKRYLAEIGATSVIHPVGEGAVNVALRVRPDVIVLDILLPDCSGWEVLRELKAHPQTCHIPIIVISVVDERSRSLALGAVEHILKPLSRQKFHQALNRIYANIQVPSAQTALIIAAMEIAHMPKILLAEDNEANITTMMSYLEAHDFQIVLARNGLEAVKMAKQHLPDLIIMDIQMPEMDGLEAIRQIRDYLSTQAIPIIAVTALAMPGDLERCLEAGANRYLAKPVRLKQLLEIITQQLSAKDG